MSRIVESLNGKDGQAPSLEQETSTGVLNRPTVKLANVVHKT